MRIRDKLVSGPRGFGSAPLGDMFRDIPGAEAAANVDAAWQQGIRHVDTAPVYGAGLSEMRLGRALPKHKRDEYVLSSKVSRLILDEVESGPPSLVCRFRFALEGGNDEEGLDYRGWDWFWT